MNKYSPRVNTKGFGCRPKVGPKSSHLPLFQKKSWATVNLDIGCVATYSRYFQFRDWDDIVSSIEKRHFTWCAAAVFRNNKWAETPSAARIIASRSSERKERQKSAAAKARVAEAAKKREGKEPKKKIRPRCAAASEVEDYKRAPSLWW